MKKLLTFLLIGFIMIIGTQTTMAATKKKSTETVESTKYVTNSNIEKLVDKYGPDVKKFINTNTKTIKDGYTYLYTVTVKQQLYDGYGSLYISIISLLIAFVFFIFANWAYNVDNDVFTVVLIVIGVILGIIFLVDIFYFIFRGYYQIKNPQYYAIQHIINTTLNIVRHIK